MKHWTIKAKPSKSYQKPYNGLSSGDHKKGEKENNDFLNQLKEYSPKLKKYGKDKS